jgi:hypothetical protein
MMNALVVLALAALPFDDGGWTITDPKARVESLGGKTALRLTTGMALRKDIDLADGTIEFDVWSTGERAFAYLHFRMESEADSEAVYLRLHKTRLPDAVQYDPFYQRVGNWQLYHGPESTAAAELPAGRWIHVRVILKGEKAVVFVGDGAEPTLRIPKLARGTRGGFIGLRSFLGVNVKTDVEPPSSFANVVVKKDVVDFDFSKVVEAPAPEMPGLVKAYRLSPAFVPPEGPMTSLPEEVLKGASQVVPALPSGLVMIAKHVKLPPQARRYATVASLRVRAPSAGYRRLRLGFSDEASVFVNGQLLFTGDLKYSFNFPRQEGLITLDNAAIYLPLKEGDNEIRIAVAEVFGGWGLMARFEDSAGLVIEP